MAPKKFIQKKISTKRGHWNCQSSLSEACHHCIALTDTNRDAKLVPGHGVVTQQFCLHIDSSSGIMCFTVLLCCVAKTIGWLCGLGWPLKFWNKKRRNQKNKELSSTYIVRRKVKAMYTRQNWEMMQFDVTPSSNPFNCQCLVPLFKYGIGQVVQVSNRKFYQKHRAHLLYPGISILSEDISWPEYPTGVTMLVTSRMFWETKCFSTIWVSQNLLVQMSSSDGRLRFGFRNFNFQPCNQIWFCESHVDQLHWDAQPCISETAIVMAICSNYDVVASTFSHQSSLVSSSKINMFNAFSHILILQHWWTLLNFIKSNTAFSPPVTLTALPNRSPAAMSEGIIRASKVQTFVVLAKTPRKNIIS